MFCTVRRLIVVFSGACLVVLHCIHFIGEEELLFCFSWVCLFVCVEVLRPSQPNGVMSSAVSLPYHTFTGQA